MSFINEALKKAQKDKDTHYIEYSEVLAAQGRDRTLSKFKLLWCSLFIIVILGLGFLVYSILNSREEPPAFVAEEKQITPRTLKKIPAQATPEKKEDIQAGDLYSMAKKHHTEGNLQEAKTFYLESLKLDPGFLDSLNNLGIIFINEKNYGNAREYLEKAVRLKPEYPDPYYNLACLFSITGNTGQGLEYLKKAVFLDRAVVEWAKKDTDLENLRGLDEFERLVNKQNME